MCIPEVIQLPVGCAEDSKFGRAESELQTGKCLGQGKFWIFLCIFTSDLFHANWALYLLKLWYLMLCMSYLGCKVTFNKKIHNFFSDFGTVKILTVGHICSFSHVNILTVRHNPVQLQWIQNKHFVCALVTLYLHQFIHVIPLWKAYYYTFNLPYCKWS